MKLESITQKIQSIIQKLQIIKRKQRTKTKYKTIKGNRGTHINDTHKI